MYFEMNFEMSDLCFIAGCISCTLKYFLVFSRVQKESHNWALIVKHHLLFFYMILKADFPLHQHVQFNFVYLFVMEISINLLKMIFC